MGLHEIILLVFVLVGGLLSIALAQYVWEQRADLGRIILCFGDRIVDRYFVNRYADDYADEYEEEIDTRTGMQNHSVPDMYQSEPAGIAPVDTGTVLPDTAALVTHLAQIRLTTGSYAMSANRIVASVEMSRNDVLALVRQARNEPEPVHGPQFEQVGEKQQFKRVGVKPIR